MKVLSIASQESLESAVAEIVRLKIQHKQLLTAKDAEISALDQRHQAAISLVLEDIAAGEALVQDYCTSNRSALFPEKKSRETLLAEFGFELTPHRVETSSRKVKWKDVVKRLMRLSWGKAYVNKPEPKPDKQALLADREKLTDEQQLAAGIQFCQDEQFFIRPKLDSADPTSKTV